MNETADYIIALRQIIDACHKPFGKDARRAKKIASEVLKKWGKTDGLVCTSN